MRLGTLTALNAERAARRACLLVTSLVGGDQRLVLAAEVDADPLGAALRERLRSGRSGTVDGADGRAFVEVHAPPIRIVAIGAVHISQALAPLARLLGHDLTIIDPRTAFATPERFPDAVVLATWPDDALEQVPLDRYTAFLALTHDPKIDDPGLLRALRSECFYVGALGSRKTHARRVERLAAAGIPPAELSRIRAPIGLPIGAVSPAEIALAIGAEITAALRLDASGARRAA